MRHTARGRPWRQTRPDTLHRHWPGAGGSPRGTCCLDLGGGRAYPSRSNRWPRLGWGSSLSGRGLLGGRRAGALGRLAARIKTAPSWRHHSCSSPALVNYQTPSRVSSPPLPSPTTSSSTATPRCPPCLPAVWRRLPPQRPPSSGRCSTCRAPSPSPPCARGRA